MTEPADFAAEIADLRKNVEEAVAHLAHATPQMATGEASGAHLVAATLSNAPAITERAARLAFFFERVTAVVADDFASIDQFRGPENLAGLLSDAARQKARAARVRRLALRARLDMLLSSAGTICRLLDEERVAMRSAREACEERLERLTQQAVSASKDLEDTERRLGVLELDIAKTERGFGLSTGREGAAALTEDHADRATDRWAAATRIAGLRKTREEAEERIAATEPLFAGLSKEIAALDAVRQKLATDLESSVLLHSAACERMREEGIDSTPVRSEGYAEIVAELMELRARGALSIRDIERRKAAADSTFAELFPHIVEQPAAAAEGKRLWPIFPRRNRSHAD